MKTAIKWFTTKFLFNLAKHLIKELRDRGIESTFQYVDKVKITVKCNQKYFDVEGLHASLTIKNWPLYSEEGIIPLKYASVVQDGPEYFLTIEVDKLNLEKITKEANSIINDI